MRFSKASGSAGVHTRESVSSSTESSKKVPPAALSSLRTGPVSTERSQKPVTAAVPAGLKWSTT